MSEQDDKRLAETSEPDIANKHGDEEESLTLIQNFKILFGASRAFWLVNLANLGDSISYFGIVALLTIFIHDKVGFSDNMTHIAFSSFTGAVTLFMLFGGAISDKIGVRHALSLSLLLLVVGRLALVGSPAAGGFTSAALWISLMLMAAGEGIIQPAMYAGVKEYTDPRTATIGYSLLYSIMNLGIFAEHIVSPFVRGHGASSADMESGGNIAAVFLILTALTAVFLLANFFFFTKRLSERERVVNVEEEAESDSMTFWEKFRALPVMDPRFLFFISILLPVRTLFAHQWLTLPQYIQRCYPVEVFARYEWLVAINPFIIIIFVPLFAMFTRKVKVINMMIIGTAVSAITTFLLVPGPDLTRLILYISLFSMGEALWSSRFLEYVAHLAPAGRVGAYMGIAGVPWFMAKTTTGFYSGRMMAHFVPPEGPTDSSTLWLIYAFIAIISPVGLILAKRWIEKGVKG